LRVWILSVGEPLPIDPGPVRLLRRSLFARTLAASGHEVVWWASTFDHNQKRQRFESDVQIDVEGMVLRLLHARAYAVNISIGRLVNHHQLARAFERAANATPAGSEPDVILAGMPTVELAAAATAYGQRRGIPVVLDIRDMHPDIYLSLVPNRLRSLARLLLTPLYRDLRTALRLADGMVAIAPSFVDWALRHSRRSTPPVSRVFPLAYPHLDSSTAAVDAAANEMRALGVRPERTIVWYVGTFNRWIDLDTVIQAARILADGGRDDVQFVFSGSGDFESEWRRLAADLPNVVFTGWIGVPHIIFMRSIAQAGLAPYRPGFVTVGNKLFEYMAGGLPILLSIGGDAKTLIERHQCGLSYVGGDPASLVSAIRRMTTDGVQATMAANSLSAYRQHYAADKVYSEMAEFVLGFAKRNGSSSS
jgi:glycosyltransferase involved in cell wall biosynthesis